MKTQTRRIANFCTILLILASSQLLFSHPIWASSGSIDENCAFASNVLETHPDIFLHRISTIPILRNWGPNNGDGCNFHLELSYSGPLIFRGISAPGFPALSCQFPSQKVICDAFAGGGTVLNELTIQFEGDGLWEGPNANFTLFYVEQGSGTIGVADGSVGQIELADIFMPLVTTNNFTTAASETTQ